MHSIIFVNETAHANLQMGVVRGDNKINAHVQQVTFPFARIADWLFT